MFEVEGAEEVDDAKGILTNSILLYSWFQLGSDWISSNQHECLWEFCLRSTVCKIGPIRALSYFIWSSTSALFSLGPEPPPSQI